MPQHFLLDDYAIFMQKVIKSIYIRVSKCITKPHFFYSIVFIFSIGLFVISFDGVHAQATGESIVKCGSGTTVQSACKLDNIGQLVKDVLLLVVSIGLPILFMLVAWRMIKAWFALQKGNANAYKEALTDAGQALIGFIFIVFLIGGGLYAALTFFGVKPEFVKVLKLFSDGGLFTQVYAEGLPAPTTAQTAYEYLIDAFRLVMKFFIFPALIVMWVWTGFSFVLAQGAPEALTKAKSLLVKAFISTLVIVVLQGFLMALQGSVNKIIGAPRATTQDPNYSNEGRNRQPVEVNNPNYSNEGRNAQPTNNTNYSNEGRNAPPPVEAVNSGPN